MDRHFVYAILFTFANYESRASLPFVPTGIPTPFTPASQNTGSIASPNYPSSYPNYYWSSNFNDTEGRTGYLGSIRVPSNVQYVEVRFTSFDTEECGTDCTCDGLKISAVSKPLCGHLLPNGDGLLKIDRHQIKNGILSFYFYSDGSVTGKGFYLTYRLIRGSQQTSHTCGTSTCSYCSYGSYYSRDFYGCLICSCHTAYPTTHDTKNSYLLQILGNLEHRAETLQNSAHDLQEELKMALDAILKRGSSRR